MPYKIENLTCANCRYFHLPGKLPQGECRRHSPRVWAIVAPSADFRQEDWEGFPPWPSVKFDQWCGEHSKSAYEHPPFGPASETG